MSGVVVLRLEGGGVVEVPVERVAAALRDGGPVVVGRRVVGDGICRGDVVDLVLEYDRGGGRLLVWEEGMDCGTRWIWEVENSGEVLGAAKRYILERCNEECRGRFCGGGLCDRRYWLCLAKCAAERGVPEASSNIGSWLLAGLV